jgi:hypothetical protein
MKSVVNNLVLEEMKNIKHATRRAGEDFSVNSYIKHLPSVQLTDTGCLTFGNSAALQVSVTSATIYDVIYAQCVCLL